MLPRTPVEKKLAQLWAEVLRLDQVSIYDNFFEAGGHSLLASRLLSRIQSVFQIELPLRTIFEVPTIMGLSQEIEMAQANHDQSRLNLITPVSREQYAVKVSAQGVVEVPGSLIKSSSE